MNELPVKSMESIMATTPARTLTAALIVSSRASRASLSSAVESTARMSSSSERSSAS
jgi:hypothetical protein